MQRAVALLARREYSRSELRLRMRRLLPPDDDGAAIDPLLDTLEGKGLLSDRRFAVGLSRTRSPRFGSARLQQDLRARGVNEDLIREAIGPLASSEIDRARALCERRFPAAARSTTELARRQRFLASRGFSFDTIRRVLGPISVDPEDPAGPDDPL
jgi:regulatory protein